MKSRKKDQPLDGSLCIDNNMFNKSLLGAVLPAEMTKTLSTTKQDHKLNN
jgi:hypothetical protein